MGAPSTSGEPVLAPRSRRTTRSVLAAALVGSLLLAACGSSGGDDADDEATTTVATDESTPTTEAGDEGDEGDEAVDEDALARAEAIDLTVSDFPDGWEAVPVEDEDVESPLDACDPSFTDDSTELAAFRDDDFVLGDLDVGDGTNVAVETKVFTSEDDAVAAIAPFGDEAVLACVDEALKGQFGADGANTIEGEFTADDYPSTLVDETVAASAEYTITGSDGSTQQLLVAVLLLRTGDLATQLLILSVGGGLDPADVQGAVARVEELQAA
jgi:hypothetical protein